MSLILREIQRQNLREIQKNRALDTEKRSVDSGK